MPSYEYRCNECQYEFEEFHKTFSDPHPSNCPRCDGGIEQLISAGLFIVYGNPTTVGQQAESNSKKLGKEQIQLIEERKNNQKTPFTGRLPDGAQAVQAEKPTEIPWYRAGLENPQKPLDLTKLKDPKKYVVTGDKK